jgi:hypothetical protein
MRIGIDYDGTFTAAPEFWRNVMTLAHRHGHEVVCVTMRRTDGAGGPDPMTFPGQVVFTAGKAKAEHCAEIGLVVDVWVDDNPHYILNDVRQ